MQSQYYTYGCCCQVEDYVVGVSAIPERQTAGQQAAGQHSRPSYNNG